LRRYTRSGASLFRQVNSAAATGVSDVAEPKRWIALHQSGLTLRSAG